MNLCVKTGARVLINEYGGVAAADLFLVGDTLVAYLGSGRYDTPLAYDTDSKASATHQVNLGFEGHYHVERGVITAPLRCWRGELVLAKGKTQDARALAQERELSLPCPTCKGAGDIDIPHPSGDPQLETFARCGECGGTGTIEPTQDRLDVLAERLEAFEKLTDQYRGALLAVDRMRRTAIVDDAFPLVRDRADAELAKALAAKVPA